MDQNKSQDRAARDFTGARRKRLTILRDLVGERGYEVRSDDVAASIIRDAIVVAAPLPPAKPEH